MLEVGGGARAEMGRGLLGDGGRRRSEGRGRSFQGPDRDWVTSAIKCCMNIQEFRMDRRRNGLETYGRTNGIDYGRTEERRLGSLKFEEGLLTAGDLTQKVVTASSLTENREKQPNKEKESARFTSLLQEPATLVNFPFCKGKSVYYPLW